VDDAVLKVAGEKSKEMAAVTEKRTQVVRYVPSYDLDFEPVELRRPLIQHAVLTTRCRARQMRALLGSTLGGSGDDSAGMAAAEALRLSL
jgi:hypothetical protein